MLTEIELDSRYVWRPHRIFIVLATNRYDRLPFLAANLSHFCTIEVDSLQHWAHDLPHFAIPTVEGTSPFLMLTVPGCQASGLWGADLSFP